MTDVEKRFGDTLVQDVYELIVMKPSVVKKGTSIKNAIEEMLQNPLSHKVYVVDERGKLVGVITANALLKALGYRVGVKGMSALSYYRFMRDALGDDVDSALQKVASVKRETKLIDALNTMVKNQWDALPVVDGENRLIGELVSLEMFCKGRELFQ